MAVCVGSCMEVVDGLLDVKVDPAGGLECTEAGLKANFPATYSPTESPDACNGFEVRENGLYAPCPDAIVGAHPYVTPGDVGGADLTPGGGPYNFESDVATITNTTCCQVQGRISTRAGGIRLEMADGFRAIAYLEIKITGGAWTAASPDTTIYCENSQGVPINIGLNNLLDENLIVIDPGNFETYQARVHLIVTAGTADGFGVPTFEFNWVCPQTGCC